MHPLSIHLIDGTYELFRHFYGRRRFEKGDFPTEVLGKDRECALLFKDLATLRSDAPLFKKVEDLRWRGPTDTFATIAAQMGDARILERSRRAAGRAT